MYCMEDLSRSCLRSILSIKLQFTRSSLLKLAHLEIVLVLGRGSLSIQGQNLGLGHLGDGKALGCRPRDLQIFGHTLMRLKL